MLALIDHTEHLLRRLRPRLAEALASSTHLRRVLADCCAEMERALTLRARNEGPRADALATDDPGARRRLAIEGRRRALGLTGRQLEIADLVGQGCADKEIGTALGIATQTVKNHLKRMYEVTAARGRAELVRLLHEAAPSGTEDSRAGPA